jgi:hypothetical protein
MPGNDEREKPVGYEELEDSIPGPEQWKELASLERDIRNVKQQVMDELAKREKELEAKGFRDSVLEQRKGEAIRFVAHQRESLNTEELQKFLQEPGVLREDYRFGQHAKERQLWREWARNMVEITGAAIIGDVTDQQLRDEIRKMLEQLKFKELL